MADTARLKPCPEENRQSSITFWNRGAQRLPSRNADFCGQRRGYQSDNIGCHVNRPDALSTLLNLCYLQHKTTVNLRQYLRHIPAPPFSAMLETNQGIRCLTTQKDTP